MALKFLLGLVGYMHVRWGAGWLVLNAGMCFKSWGFGALFPAIPPLGTMSRVLFVGFDRLTGCVAYFLFRIRHLPC